METRYPKMVRKNPFGHRGNYYIGHDESSSNKTPIVFVHGLHSHPEKWFMKTNHHGKNDMYELAANYGHPTAFVDLSNERYGIRENGQLLSNQLKEIYHRFGQKN
ncbi:hypothetical protein [Tepidibacillus marianensis]|uniref:esterase/lipase family protein n=1 Tax=Tepidibacillus marianensis TaxID=3131995 RepID=UPI0030D2DDE2